MQGVKKKRFFVGFSVPDDVLRWAEEWKRRHEEDLGNVRWVPNENIHITAVPPWHEESENTAVERLEDFLKYEEFPAGKIVFDRVEYGPKGKNKRLIWMSGKADKGTSSFVQKIEERFEHKPRRDWIPHVTLARFRHEKHNLKKEILPANVDFSFSPEKIVLYQSHLKPTGAEYQKIHTVNLNTGS